MTSNLAVGSTEALEGRGSRKLPPERRASIRRPCAAAQKRDPAPEYSAGQEARPLGAGTRTVSQTRETVFSTAAHKKNARADAKSRGAGQRTPRQEPASNLLRQRDAMIPSAIFGVSGMSQQGGEGYSALAIEWRLWRALGSFPGRALYACFPRFETLVSERSNQKFASAAGARSRTADPFKGGLARPFAPQ